MDSSTFRQPSPNIGLLSVKNGSVTNISSILGGAIYILRSLFVSCSCFRAQSTNIGSTGLFSTNTLIVTFLNFQDLMSDFLNFTLPTLLFLIQLDYEIAQAFLQGYNDIKNK